MRRLKAKIISNILLILLALLGIGALFGGGVLIISPLGKLFAMPYYYFHFWVSIVK